MTKISLTYCILCFVLVSCEKKKDTIDREKYFDSQNIEMLELENVPGFWDDTDTNIIVSDSHGFYLVNDTGFVEGCRYSGNEKGIVISVFETKETAIAAMEYRIQNVVCLILPGEPGEIEEIWWYSDCIPNCIFVNLWNTIIEVYYYHVNYEEVEDILYNTAKGVMERVNDLSTEIIL